MNGSPAGLLAVAHLEPGTLLLASGVIALSAWLIGAIWISAAAGARGRRRRLWFLLGIVVTPIIAGILLFRLKDLTGQTCSLCRKWVTAQAAFCRHCGHRFEPAFRPPRAL